MNKSIILGAALFCAAFVPNLIVRGHAADAKAPDARSGETSPQPAAKATRSVPFRGKIAALDTSGSSFTLSGPKKRVFHIAADSKIEKDGKPARLADLAIGDEARGLYQKDDDGQMNIVKASFGPKNSTASNTNPKKEIAGQ